MGRAVDGEKWVARGWMSVLQVLYETDVVVNLSHVYSTQEMDQERSSVVENLPSNSELLTETNLTENQAIIELNHLLDEGLVHYIRPFEDTDYVVYRLTEDGYRVVHEKQQAEKKDERHSKSQKIDIILLSATVVLAVTALIRAYLVYIDV